MKNQLKLLAASLLLATLNQPFAAAPAQGTTFVYQGLLTTTNGPANGSFDLTFALYNGSDSGVQVGITLTNAATPVSNGAFSVALDFGASFPGAGRWLEIGVCTNGAGSFVPLSPRQPILPVPYAITAGNAVTATSAASAGTAVTAGLATGFSGVLGGDVTGAQGATLVGKVGGVTAANVAAGANAANAATSGNTAGTLVMRDTVGNFSAGTVTATAFTGNGSGLTNLSAANLLGTFTGNMVGNATSATNLSGVLGGDVTGTQGATMVGKVGGVTAVNVAAGANAANAATSTNTPGTLVARDASGNFSAGTVIARAFTGNGSGLTNLSAANLSGTFTGNMVGNASSATNLSGVLGGDVTGTQGATVVGKVGGVTAVNVAAGANAANAATSTNTAGTLVARDASGNFSAGTVTATAFTGNGSGLTNLNAVNLSGTFTGNMVGNASSATNLSGVFGGDVTGPQGATVVVTVGGATAANVAAGVNAANAAASGNTAGTLVARDAGGNFSAGTVTAATFTGNGSGLTNLNAAKLVGTFTGNVVGNASNATNFIGSLTGDVTGTQGATVVAKVGGVTAANVASGANAANAATSATTASAIVQRDASGNFNAGTVTATAFIGSGAGLTNLNATKLAGTFTGNVVGNASNATNFSGSLSGDVTGTQGVTVVAKVGGVTAANVASGANAANAATSANTASAIVQRDVSGNVTLNNLTLAGNLNLPSSTNGAGAITVSGTRFLHAYGTANVFVGAGAGNLTMLGSDNVGVGSQALHAISFGGANTANGSGALKSNTDGSCNVAIGSFALTLNSSGVSDTACGYNALSRITTGNNNIALGYQAGMSLDPAANNNIDIGNQGTASDNNIIRIGSGQSATYLPGTVYAAGVALTSDRNAKEHFTAINSQEVLARVAALPVMKWNYKADNASVQHIGPMAQDFQAAFGLAGPDDRHISVVDEGGVALAAIQGLNEKQDAKDAKIRELEARLVKLEQLLKEKLDGPDAGAGVAVKH